MSLQRIIDFDAQLSKNMRVAEKPGVLRNVSIFFAHSGDSWFWAIALVALWVSGNSFSKKWAVEQFVGISVLAVMVLSIKFLVRRRRPEGEWGGIYRNTDPHSFPSGHAARSFLIAVVASALDPMGVLTILLWVWAVLVALARVAMGVHFVSDVVAGAILGVVVALIGLKMYDPILQWATSIIGFPLW